MAGVKVGTANAVTMKVGTTQVQKMYLGASQMWSNIQTGQKCLINNVYVSNLQFGYNVLGAASTAIKPTKFYFGGEGSYYDDPWGPGTIYFYGIRASDGGRDLIASYYAGAHDWYTGANTITMSGTVAYTNINIYAGGGPKTTMRMTAYFSEWTT